MDFASSFLLSMLAAISNSFSETTQAKKTPPAKVQTATYFVSTNNNCKVYNPHPREDETLTWSGKCLNGYAEGEGVVSWFESGTSTGSSRGTMAKGKLNGLSEIIYINPKNGKTEEIFQGTIIDSIRNGMGTQNWSDGVYEGHFKDNKWHGYGVVTLSKDKKYAIAAWRKDGFGRYINDSYVINGIFKNGDIIFECQKQDCPSKLLTD